MSAYPACRLVNPEYLNDFPSLTVKPHCEVIHVSMQPNARRGGKETGWTTTGSLERKGKERKRLQYHCKGKGKETGWRATGKERKL